MGKMRAGLTSEKIALICNASITSGHSRLANWRLLFLVEGLPTICMAPIAYFFFPDTPDKARFLNEEEKVFQDSVLWFQKSLC